jgi:hypothetical protein
VTNLYVQTRSHITREFSCAKLQATQMAAVGTRSAELNKFCFPWEVLTHTKQRSLPAAVTDINQISLLQRHQHNTTQHNTAQHSTAQHSRAQHSTAEHSTAQHNTAQHSTTQHNTAQHSTTQHSTTQAEQSTKYDLRVSRRWLWSVAPCRLVRVYQRFGRLYCLHH